jgi:hypothetical protein
VADLDARTESFIAMLLGVSGRARPQDLQGIAPSDAAEVLRKYAEANAAMGVLFDGQALTISARPAPTPVPTPVPEVPLAPPADEAAWNVPSAPVPSSFAESQATFETTPAIPEVGAQAPALSEEPIFVPAPPEGEDFPPGIPPLVEPALAPSLSEPVELAPLEPPASTDAQVGIAVDEVVAVPAPPAPEAAAAVGFEPAPATDFEPLPGVEAPLFNEPMLMDQPAVQWYWWLVAVFFGWVGGLVGFLLIRSSNPRGARNVLLVGIGVSVLSAVIAVVSVMMMGGSAFFGR